MVGKYGLTSSEKEYTSQYTNTYSYSYAYGGGTNPNSFTFKKPPRPTAWCFYCIERLDVAMLFDTSWFQLLGSTFFSAVTGLNEATERLSEHGYYSWLRTFPLLSKHHARPRIVHNKFTKVGAKKGKAAAVADTDEFSAVAQAVCIDIGMQYRLAVDDFKVASDHMPSSTSLAVLVQSPMESTKSGGVGSGAAVGGGGAGDEGKFTDLESFDIVGLGALAEERAAVAQESSRLDLVKKWIQALVAYAPSMSQLSLLLRGELAVFCVDDASQKAAGTPNMLSYISAPFATRLEGADLQSEDFDTLDDIIRSIEGLRTPKIGAALLKNSYATDSIRILRFVQQCATSYIVPVPSIAVVATGAGACTSGGTNGLDGLDAAVGEVKPAFLEGEWLELNAAAKDWISKNHSVEPETLGELEPAAPKASTWGWGTYATPVQPRRRPPTAGALMNTRKRSMKLALDDMEMLFQLQVFQQHPQGILFELSRCWFMNSVRSSTVLEALFSFGDGPRPFHAFSKTLATFLEDRVLKLVREGETAGLADLAVRFLSSDSALLHSIMYHIVVYTVWPESVSLRLDPTMESLPFGSPTLLAILAHYDMWRVVLGWSESIRSTQRSVAVILDAAKTVISDVAASIVDNVVLVKDLNIISPKTGIGYVDTFLDLCGLFSSTTPLERRMLEARIHVLRKFDRKLEEVQTYASFFCSCGVRVEAVAVRMKVDAVKSEYNNLVSRQLPSAFDGVAALGHVSWLYDLRSSEIFLQLWRSVGSDVCKSSVAGAQEELDAEDADGHSGLADLFGEVEIAAEDEAVPEEVRMQRAAARFQSVDRRALLRSQVEGVILNQETVVAEVIPRVQIEWEELANEIFHSSISIHKLEKVFGPLEEAQLQEELNLLSHSLKRTLAVGGPPLEPGERHRKELVRTASNEVKDFMLLRKLSSWLPALKELHDLVAELIQTPVEEDALRRTLVTTMDKIKSGWSDQTLLTIPDLVVSIKGVFAKFDPKQLDFIAALSSSPKLIRWLLDQKSTESFNSMLQVVRPCTDEPRLLSAIASLVHIRTLLLNTLYPTARQVEGGESSAATGGEAAEIAPYLDFEHFIDSFQGVELSSDGSQTESATWHLNNVIISFDAFTDILVKQTKSPGIKSIYDLQELLHNHFILRAHSDIAKVLSIEVSKSVPGAAGTAPIAQVKEQSLEELLDLRSKLLMTEVPEELENEMHASVMIESFVLQLQVLSSMSDLVATLHIAGHVQYQNEFTERIIFTLDGLPGLQLAHEELRVKADAWSKEVKRNRADFYYLNFFTMREILRMRLLAMKQEEVMLPAEKVVEIAAESGSTGALATTELISEEVLLMEGMGFNREWAIVGLHKSGNIVDQAIDYCFSHTQHMDRIIAAELPTILGQSHRTHPTASDATQGDKVEVELDPRSEIQSTLNQIRTNVPMELVERVIAMWRTRLENDEPILSSLGEVLGSLFSDRSEESRRRLSLPGDHVANRGDLLYVVDDGSEKKLPVFVTCAEEQTAVIDTVLSIYVRRGRLPEPGEVLFCTSSTTNEELSILLLRFITAKDYGLGDDVFCIADIHNLSYTQQCTLVEQLRVTIQEHGQDKAGTLVIVSGKPRQMVLNSLSAHQVDLPPLATQPLRVACAEAFRVHSGEVTPLLIKYF